MITARTLLRAGLAMLVFMALVAVGGTAAAQAGVLGAESTAAGGPSSGPSASPQPYATQESEKGDKGSKGDKGKDGKDGRKGKDGEDGDDGKDGRNGSNGSTESAGRTGQIVGSYDVDLDPPASNDGFSQIGSDDIPYGSVATG